MARKARVAKMTPEMIKHRFVITMSPNPGGGRSDPGAAGGDRFNTPGDEIV